MDEQFDGRTDDDLFADEFEPVSASEANDEEHAATREPECSTPAPTKPHNSAKTSPDPNAPSPPIEWGNLSQSRHNPASPNPPRQPRPVPPNNDKGQHASSPAPDNTARRTKDTSDTNSQPHTPPNRANHRGGRNAGSRLGSGANPRTKPTDTELADKMARMRILSAEKTQKFERAQRDETEHAVAYERGMEEARKRRAADEERRRREQEGRKRMDEERERNRERKLHAMGMKKGGWDEGKDERMAEEARRDMFRGANGGVRGARNVGLAGSRYATIETGLSQGDHGERGRGRRRGGRTGRGGRGAFSDGFVDGNQNSHQSAAPRNPANQPTPSKDDFPALPPGPVNTERLVSSQDALDLPLSPPVGKWADEVTALEEKNVAALKGEYPV